MMSRVIHAAVVIGLLMTCLLFLSFSFDPPDGSTGAPGNLLCSGCHQYSGGTQSGSMEICGIPATIAPSTTYPVEIKLIKSSGVAEFAGFQVVAISGNLFNSPSAGTWSNPGPNVHTSTIGIRTYLEHFGEEFAYSSSSAPQTITYTADWTSPATSTDNIWFYGAGNISSMIGTDGDLIVTDIISNLPLPVELVSFTAEAFSDRQVHLRWQTASEVNSESFEVLRSKNGVAYESLGHVMAAGESNQQQSYQFTDTAPFRSGNVFYKLKMIDRDGAFHYSPIKTINLRELVQAQTTIHIYPNPATPEGCLFIEVFAQDDMPFTHVAIFHSSGQRVLEDKQLSREIHGGLNRFVFDVAHLSSGIYLVALQTGGYTRLSKQILILP